MSFRYEVEKPFKRVAVDVLDEEELPTRVSGLVRVNDNGSVEWRGDVVVLDRECLDDWAELNSGNLSSRQLASGRLLMRPLDQSKPKRLWISTEHFLEALFTPPSVVSPGLPYGGDDVYDNLAVLKEAYENAPSSRPPDFEERVRRLRERQGR